MKKLIRNTLVLAILGYILVSLPLVMVFLFSKYWRFSYFEIITERSAEILPLEYIFVGDSITKGGDNWGFKLVRNPFISKNLAENNYTTNQIVSLVNQALKYSPNYVFIMAGTNDVISGDIEVQQTLHHYQALLDKFARSKSVPIITLIPLQQDIKRNAQINQINSGIKLLAKARSIYVIDLNESIAPLGYLEPKFTIDGVHFSEAAYEIWLNEIEKILSQLTSSVRSSF